MPRRPSYKFTSKPERTLRALRQTAGTVYLQLLAQGFTPAEIEAELDSSPGTRRIGLAAVEQHGSNIPVIGVSYGGDFRSEEETGIPQIAAALSSGDSKGRVVTGEVEGHWYLGVHADSGTWGGQERVERNAATALRRSRDVARGEHWQDRWLKVAELRQGLRDVGYEGTLPRTKTELQALFATHVRGQHELANVGEFHHGDTLILLPAGPVITAALRILAESGKHLRMGGSSTPFGVGATLYDDRDLTGETIEAQRAHRDYIARMNRKAEPARKALQTKGMLYALSPGKRKGGKDYFWLNYCPRGYKQQFGWYTLTELMEKHASGNW